MLDNNDMSSPSVAIKSSDAMGFIKDPVKCRVNSALRHRQMCARAHYSCTSTRRIEGLDTPLATSSLCTRTSPIAQYSPRDSIFEQWRRRNIRVPLLCGLKNAPKKS